MKKFVSLFLAIVMGFLLIGCGADNDVEQETETQKAELSRGEIDGDVYKNSYLGFTFTKPASWVYFTDEEIAAAINIGVDSFLGEDFKTVLEDNTAIYDMMAVDTLTGSNINVGYENLSKTFATDITEEQYAEALKQQFAGITEMTVTFPDELDTVTLGETEFTRVLCSTEAYGISMTQVYYLHKADKYMRFIIVTIPSGYTVEDIQAMFQ